eukprot:GEMP01086128.1.p1 GENE.GEMP01086128.1~~GEMP01086128.1.p1  ORF type:complete len:122 (+),score=23.56 GEMP01086128.1:85-450(+)
MAPILTIRWEGTLALVSLGSSENRLDDQMVFQLHAILDECQSKCSGLILFAEGKFFSNGHDAEWMQRTPHAKLVDVIGATEELLPLAREHARKWERLASSTYGVMKKELYRETIDVLRARL